jgi:hypothetical protein
MRAHYESNGLFMFRTNGMSRSHGCERVTMFRTNGRDFLFLTNHKYLHPLGNVKVHGCERVTMFRMNGRDFCS